MIYSKEKIKAPAISPDNPGIGHTLKLAFANAGETWEEQVNLVECLIKTLKENEIIFKSDDSWVELSKGIVLQPQIVSFNPLNDGGVKTTTTIAVTHKVKIPKGLFEYQHSTGDNTEESITTGFESWVKVDLNTILESLSDELTQCTLLKISFPDRKNNRVIVLGPVSYYFTEEIEIEEEHPFCSCCFFTNNFESFKELLEDDEVYGIRFFVARKQDGTIDADCRVNGIDFEPGKKSLIKYGSTWPNRGFEFRKQFVIMKSMEPQSELA